MEEAIIHLDHGHTYAAETGILHSCSNGGLFSNFYHTLWSLIDLRNQGISPDHIDFSAGFELFREHWGEDLYPLFFAAPPAKPNSWSNSPAASATPLPRLDHHGTYAVYPYELLSAIRDTYFRPSEAVLNRKNALARKYDLTPGNYIALYHRGTDKGEEIKLTAAAPMLRSLQEAIHKSGISKVLVQTDDQSLLDFYLANLGSTVTVIEELPATTGAKGFHYLNHEQGLIDKKNFSLTLTAMTELLAQSDQFITSTSNLSGWACLLRGHAHGVVQFNKHGRKVTNLYAQLFRIKNRLRKLRARVQDRTVYYT
jgi:hypothetical protein